MTTNLPPVNSESRRLHPPFASWRLFLMIVVLATWTGCKNYEDRISVTGLVTLDGEPLSNGFIAFVGDEGDAVAAGPIQNGHYELSESASRDGIRAGQYAVRIESWKEPPGKELPNGTFAEGVSAIPARYQDAKASSFTADVSRKSRKFNFEMNSKEK